MPEKKSQEISVFHAMRGIKLRKCLKWEMPKMPNQADKPENSKHEARNSCCPQGVSRKQIRMTKRQNSKPYDLEDRTFAFAKRVRAFVKKLPKGSRKNKFAELALRFGSDLADPIGQKRRNSELFRGVCE